MLTPTISATAAVKAFKVLQSSCNVHDCLLALRGRCSASIKPKNVPTQSLHVKTLRYRTTWRWLYTITNIFEPCSFWHVRICGHVLMWLARLPDKIKSALCLHVASHAQTTDPPYEPAAEPKCALLRVDCPKLATVGLTNSDKGQEQSKNHRS